ncbi:MAG TPA: GNAT family N-acetyltransferase [Polyangia bacterium]|jgi:N-acetylneuraminate synthase
MALPEIRIGARRVGPGAPVYFIAEAGSNHDGDYAQAERLIDVAAEAGADAVKFQAFKAESMYPRRAGQSAYLKSARSIYEIIRDLEMPLDWIPKLAAASAARGLHFLCTPFDFQSADAMEPHVPAFKIASYDMTNYPLLQHVARKGKPLIVSTGTADLDEVRDMIAAVRAVADPGLVVLQCTAKYPAPLAALNVRTVATMTALGVLTGLSDHSREPLPGPLAAVALGGVVIEKHFTLSNSLPGPDHAYALEPAELKDLIAKLRGLEAALGSGEKVVQPEEQELRAFARRTIFTTRALAPGERLRRGDLSLLRCGTVPFGLHPREYLRLPGRSLAHGLVVESAIRAEDVAPLSLADGEVSLRPLERRDAERVFGWREDAAWSVLFPGPDGGRPESDAGAWFERLARRTDRIDFVIESGSAGAVGVVGIFDVDLAADRADLAVVVPSRAPSDGELARRAAALAVAHASEALGLRALCYGIAAGDRWSSDLAARLGVPTFTARPALPEDARFVWTVNNHPTARAQSISTGDIPWETHLPWFQARLARPDCAFLIGLSGDEPIGVARLDLEAGEAVISLAVSADHRGRGFGQRLIRSISELALARADVRVAVAYTRPSNTASRRAFARNGYREIGIVDVRGIEMCRFEKTGRPSGRDTGKSP